MIKKLVRGALVLLLAVPLLATAAPSAQEVVQQTTDRLLADLKDNKEVYRENPAAFYDALNEILGPVVDSEGISRSIMTVRYSGRATPAQMQRFEENFKRSLMQFYGNALLEYNNQEIRVLPASGAQDPERASINMEVRDEKGTVYPVSYTMVSQDGRWMMRNVVINGINVGKLFRDQFAQSMRDNRNDLDKVIDTWVDVIARTKSETGKS
ncbi:MlaC/ttg2D family ABC transporter substrate-binding protein [Pseudomonas mangrovi]|uniref:Toluene tolerance protein n=1 Tax=Pseudomonas mangrovi TaxID=2161748 RepID=A0A2T5PEY5_9PSED|nr:ABC transporter substrate-binding protein [Pseudomonas mangrovi]PTU76283.1 toluene tolerance protein [Pseudomonas mangrovi]